MQEFVQFLMHHQLLAGAFVVLLMLLFWEEYKAKAGGAGVSTQEAVRMINREKAAVLDVSDASAFREGHIAGAFNVPSADVDVTSNKLKKYQNTPLIVCDVSGQKSLQICNKLRKAGFQKVSTLKGGIDAWRHDGMPLVKN